MSSALAVLRDLFWIIKWFFSSLHGNILNSCWYSVIFKRCIFIFLWGCFFDIASFTQWDVLKIIESNRSAFSGVCFVQVRSDIYLSLSCPSLLLSAQDGRPSLTLVFAYFCPLVSPTVIPFVLTHRSALLKWLPPDPQRSTSSDTWQRLYKRHSKWRYNTRRPTITSDPFAFYK